MFKKEANAAGYFVSSRVVNPKGKSIVVVVAIGVANCCSLGLMGLVGSMLITAAFLNE